MDVLVDFIVGYLDDPVSMAALFLCFCLFMDGIVNIVNNLINGARG